MFPSCRYTALAIGLPRLVSPSGLDVFLGPSVTEADAAAAGGATSVWGAELVVSEVLAGGAGVGLGPDTGGGCAEGLAERGGGLGDACLGGGVFGSGGGGEGVWAGAGAGAAGGCDMAGTRSVSPAGSVERRRRVSAGTGMVQRTYGAHTVTHTVLRAAGPAHANSQSIPTT